VVVGPAIWGRCDWGHRTVIVNVHNYNAFNRARIINPNWAHDVDHRRGVPYRDDATRREYRRELPGAEARRDFRGYQPPPSRYRELPRPSGAPIREEPTRPGARPVPGAADRVPPVSPTPRQPPSVGQRLPVAPPVAQQPPGVEQRVPPAPSVSRVPPSVGQRFPVAPSVAGQPPGANQRVPPAFETFPRGDAARTYSDRGAASRGTQTYAPPAGAQGARPPGGAAQSVRPQGARPPSR
jgi:hypothetical protein